MRGRATARCTLVLTIAGLLATGCSGADEEAVTGSPLPSVSSEPEPTESPSPLPTWPLTGVEDTQVVDRPVLAAKIENTRAARPQQGLEQADLVFEEVVEGGITRFAAIFHSRVPERVGPIRSARLVDVDILAPFTPILVYSGARPDVTDALIRSQRIGLLPDDGRPVFLRDPDRSSSHDLFALTEEAYARQDELTEVGPVSTSLVFDVEPPDGGSAAGEELEVEMTPVSTTGWSFDAVEGVYRRSQDGDPFEVVGDDQVGAANVVVVLTELGTGGCCDTAGNPFVATDLVGDGTAVVLRDGRRYEARWRKARPGDHLELLHRGRPFPLAPGPTWVHLAPLDAVDAGPAATETASDDATG